MKNQQSLPGGGGWRCFSWALGCAGKALSGAVHGMVFPCGFAINKWCFCFSKHMLILPSEIWIDDDLWWLMMIYDNLWWFMMIYDDLWWFMMIYDDLGVGQNWITTWIQFCISYIGTSIQTIREEQDYLTIRHANSMGNWTWQIWILPPVKVRFHHCETGLS